MPQRGVCSGRTDHLRNHRLSFDASRGPSLGGSLLSWGPVRMCPVSVTYIMRAYDF